MALVLEIVNQLHGVQFVLRVSGLALSHENAVIHFKFLRFVSSLKIFKTGKFRECPLFRHLIDKKLEPLMPVS